MNQRSLRRSEQKAERALLRNKLWDEYQAYKKEFYTNYDDVKKWMDRYDI